MLELLTEAGGSLGNLAAREKLAEVLERPIAEAEYEAVREDLLERGLIRKTRGREDGVGRSRWRKLWRSPISAFCRMTSSRRSRICRSAIWPWS